MTTSFNEQQLENLAQFGQTEIPRVDWERHKEIEQQWVGNATWMRVIHQKRLQEEPAFAARHPDDCPWCA